MPVQALDWRFEPRIGGSVIYTDNANHSDDDPEDALILSVTPGFSLASKGSRRVRATLNYGLKGSTRFGYNDDDDIRHNLNAAGQAELIEDFLFIEGTARVSQELISMFGSLAESEIDDSNRANTGIYSISPYIQQRFGNYAHLQARYTASGSVFENSANTNNAQVNAFSAVLASGTRFNDLGWNLNYSIRKADYRHAMDTTFERFSAGTSYALSRKFRVFGTVGEDRNDYLSSSDTDGSFYRVGFGWSPMRRANIEVSAGERYFGRTYSLAGNYRARHSTWTVRYAEDVSDITQQMLQASSRVFWVCDGTLVETPDLVPPSGALDCQGPVTPGELSDLFASMGVSLADLVGANLLEVGITRGVYILKSFTTGASWHLGKLGFGLGLRDVRRLYELYGGAEDRARGVTGSVSYHLSPHTTANAALSFTRNSADAGILGAVARDDDIIGLSLGLARSFSRDLSGALTFRHTQRDSNVSSADYTENRLTATVNLRF